MTIMLMMQVKAESDSELPYQDRIKIGLALPNVPDIVVFPVFGWFTSGQTHGEKDESEVITLMPNHMLEIVGRVRIGPNGSSPGFYAMPNSSGNRISTEFKRTRYGM